MIKAVNKDWLLIYPVTELIAALSNYDRVKGEFDTKLREVESSEDIFAIEAEEAAALDQVREAFYQATKDRNSRESCMRIDIDFARKIAKFGEETGTRTDHSKQN